MIDTRAGLHITASVSDNGEARLVVHHKNYVQIIALDPEERIALKYLLTHENDDELLRAEFQAILDEMGEEEAEPVHDFKLLSIEDRKKDK